MLVSDEKRFVFVHIQKTGGISIERLLQEHVPDLRIFVGRHEHLGRVPADQLESWDDYFKFCFVRNPWDRLASWYSMIERAYHNVPSWKRIVKPQPLKKAIWNYALPYINDFDRFVAECTGEIMDGGYLKSFAYNQFDYIRGPDNECGVNFVGRFENLQNDMSEVLRHLGIENLELPHYNRGAHGRYRDFYTETTRAIVEQRFRTDIERFDYRFDG